MPLNSQAEQLAQSPTDAIDCPLLLGFLHCSSISVRGTVVVALVWGVVHRWGRGHTLGEVQATTQHNIIVLNGLLCTQWCRQGNLWGIITSIKACSSTKWYTWGEFAEEVALGVQEKWLSNGALLHVPHYRNNWWVWQLKLLTHYHTQSKCICVLTNFWQIMDKLSL